MPIPMVVLVVESTHFGFGTTLIQIHHPSNKIWSADHIYRLGGLKDRFCNPEALPQAVISDPFRVC